MRALVAAGAMAWLASCAGSAGRPAGPPTRWVGASVSAPISRDQLLVAAGQAVWRGDLWTAQADLTVLSERERGQPDPALDFWSELLALLRCEPLARVPSLGSGDAPLGNPWDQLRRLVQIERVRLGRVRPAAPKIGRWITRDGSGPATDHTLEVVWPVERERWSDEQSVPLLLTRCEAAAPGTAAATARPAPASESEIALVVRTARGMPAAHPATGPLLLQAAVLEMTRGRAAEAVADLARLGAVAPSQSETRGVPQVVSVPDVVAHGFPPSTPAGALPPRERNEAILAGALAAVADPAAPPDFALERGRAVFHLDLPPGLRRSIALLLADRLITAKRPDDAAAILGPPPHGDDAIGRYIAFRQVEAHARAGRRAELLAEAREALHRHGRDDVDADPALGAVMDLALRTLRASPVSVETMEVLEALGPPRERLSRADTFAEMALEAGAPLSAMATFAWLYDNEIDSSRRLQYLARECVAAAHAGSHADFARTFQSLAGLEEPAEPPPTAAGASARPASPRATASKRAGALIASAEAEGRHDRQRAARSVDWQRALLVVARDALTALVESDDQADLATLVATLKRHLDGAGKGPVDEELTTLYRAASAHQKQGPRAYAETVGSARRPILLGDILVGRSYDVRAPAIDAVSALEEVGPLVFVPQRGDDPTPAAALRRWPGSFRVAWTGEGP